MPQRNIAVILSSMLILSTSPCLMAQSSGGAAQSPTVPARAIKEVKQEPIRKNYEVEVNIRHEEREYSFRQIIGSGLQGDYSLQNLRKRITIISKFLPSPVRDGASVRLHCQLEVSFWENDNDKSTIQILTELLVAPDQETVVLDSSDTQITVKVSEAKKE